MSTYGSLNNMMMANGAPKAPEVGDGATQLCWSDRHPYTVISIQSPTRITVQADDAVRTDKNGMSECQSYDFRRNPSGEIVRLSLRKDGRWKRIGDKYAVFAIGYRSCYYDYSF